MKQIITILLLAVITLVNYQCQSAASQAAEGVLIEGKIAGADNLQVYLDKQSIGRASSVVQVVNAGADGTFSIAIPEGVEAGVYRLRIGAKQLNLVLNGKDGLIKVNGDLNTLQQYDVSVDDSGTNESYVSIMKGLVDKSINADGVKTYIDTVKNAYTGLLVAQQALGTNGKFIDIHKNALQKLKTQYPNAEDAKNYQLFITQVEREYASQRVRVGEQAPDIKLASPNGEQFALSDLKGQVVLLDFWASWCGPCRRENPNVVKVYDKYKDKGFTVYSVSLDGIDERTKARLGGNIDDQLQRSKERWVQAIEKDGLPWEYHVSDLKKWDSAPAGLYGVSSIPRTFLIDREGNIAAMNLRGAGQIEQALLNVL